MLVPPRLLSAVSLSAKKKGTSQVWQDPTAILEQEVSRNSRERAEDTTILGRKAEGEQVV